MPVQFVRQDGRTKSSLFQIGSLTLAVILFLWAVPNGLTEDESSTGRANFLSNCALCHGSDGGGGRGPNLRGSLRNGDRASDIERVIRNGLPGTAMPSFKFEDDELNALVRYIQSLHSAAKPSLVPRGDTKAGRQIYVAEGCSGCHQVGNEGSTLGPNLSHIGSSRSYEYLKTSVVDPSADVAEENQAITIEMQDGKRYRGVWVNEDSFTVQIRLADESFASFDKRTLKREVHEKKSLMPAYNLRDRELNDLLAYLSSLVA